MTVSPDQPPLKPWAVTPEKIRDAVQRIVVAARPLRVIAFGSVVREGVEHANDLDVIVIEKDVEDRFEETIRLRQALRGLLMPIDLIVMSEHDFKERSGVVGTVAHAALREGRVLYDAA
jgi:predicted nucleotidyltransferase